MASNKRKILEAARKYAQKGAKDKALREYHALLKLDPCDAKLHLEIGDCYRRWGQINQAITQYARVADQYKEDGFDARAVAVFKQILNLDPKRYTAYVSLSELYQSMGLDSEALSMLQAAADAHHKEGNKREALELLRRMANLDPTNTTSRLKVAELLRQEGLESDAVAEYELAAAELVRQGALESVISVEERILEVQPGRVDLVLSMGRHFVELGKADQALPLATGVLEGDPEEIEAHELLIEAHRALGDHEEVAATTRSLARIFLARGDEGRARELNQRISAGTLAFEGGVPEATEHGEPDSLEEDDLLNDEFLAADVPAEAAATDLGEIELQLSEEAEELLLEDDEPEDESFQQECASEALDAPTRAAPSESDCEQLLAEASVYLRYGKRDQAIESLEAVLEHEPDNRMALEKLGEAHAEAGRTEGAVEAWCRAAARARAEGDEEGFSALRDRVVELDTAVGEVLAEAEAASVVDPELEDRAEDSSEIEIDVEPALELQAREEASGEALSLGPDPEEASDADADGEGIDFELEIELEDEDTFSSPRVEDEASAPSIDADGTTLSQQETEDFEEVGVSWEPDLDEWDGEPLEESGAEELPASPAEEVGFDLAAELRGVIEDPDAISSDAGLLSTVGDGMQSIFSDFKQAVSATLSEDDYETRYGLGIAYREMELYDDAIGEFRMCLDSPSHKLTSLQMMGLCALELGRASDAQNHFQQVLSTPDLPKEQLGGLRFDLGRAFEAQQDFERARAAYESVLEAEPDFPGVAARLQSLDAPERIGVADEAEADPGFESFDDLIIEAEAVLGRGRDAGVESDRPERRATPRKKKISFV